MLKSIYKHAGHVVYGLWQYKRDKQIIFEDKRWMISRQRSLPTNQVEQYNTLILYDKRKEILIQFQHVQLSLRNGYLSCIDGNIWIWISEKNYLTRGTSNSGGTTVCLDTETPTHFRVILTEKSSHFRIFLEIYPIFYDFGVLASFGCVLCTQKYLDIVDKKDPC